MNVELEKKLKVVKVKGEPEFVQLIKNVSTRPKVLKLTLKSFLVSCREFLSCWILYLWKFFGLLKCCIAISEIPKTQ